MSEQGKHELKCMWVSMLVQFFFSRIYMFKSIFSQLSFHLFSTITITLILVFIIQKAPIISTLQTQRSFSALLMEFLFSKKEEEQMIHKIGRAGNKRIGRVCKMSGRLHPLCKLGKRRAWIRVCVCPVYCYVYFFMYREDIGALSDSCKTVTDHSHLLFKFSPDFFIGLQVHNL